MNPTKINRAPPDAGHPPPDLSTLTGWTLAITGTVLIAVCALVAAFAIRFAVQNMGLDAARIAAGRTVIGGGVCAVVAGAGGAVLLAMAGRLRWAVAYTCWLALGLGVVVGTVLVELGADPMDAAQQGGVMFAGTLLFPACFYAVVLMTREALVRPMFLLLDFLGDVLNGIATLTPWGPRWGKVLAVMAAIWLVIGTAAMLRG